MPSDSTTSTLLVPVGAERLEHVGLYPPLERQRAPFASEEEAAVVGVLGRADLHVEAIYVRWMAMGPSPDVGLTTKREIVDALNYTTAHKPKLRVWLLLGLVVETQVVQLDQLVAALAERCKWEVELDVAKIALHDREPLEQGGSCIWVPLRGPQEARAHVERVLRAR